MADPFSNDTIVDDTNDTNITLEDLVGDGKKYRDPNEVAKAYVHADALIEKQKADLAEANARSKVLEDLLEARQSGKPPEVVPPVRQEPPAQEPPKVDVDISELVRKEMTSASEEKRKTDNINSAAQTLNSHFGSPAKAQEAIRARASELGVGFEWLRNVASDSPAAFYASMGIAPAARSNNTPAYSPEVRLPGRVDNVRNYTYYENVRKTNPKAYVTPEIRAQMFKDAQELGDKFYTRT